VGGLGWRRGAQRLLAGGEAELLHLGTHGSLADDTLQTTHVM
jgi:hypothetical protein